MSEVSEKPTVLVVDDEPTNLDLLVDLLREDYKVKVAINGAKALKIANSSPLPDLILLDIMMPEMNGYEVCETLKGDPLTAGIPVIFLTAMSQVEDEQKGLEVGAVDYITKPISPGTLGARVKTHVQLKRMSDTLKQQNELLEKMVEERTKELAQTNESLARFVPDQFIQALGHNNILEVKLGDQIEGRMTVLFCDIRSYTSLAEKMTPQETFDFLNGYLGRIGPIILEHNGFVNQFYGDGIMAIFPHSADDAVRGTIAMLETLKDYNKGRLEAGRDPIEIGIGVNTGDLRMGVIGDGARTDTGVVADTVNTAARMEGMTKYYGVTTVISDTTYEDLEDPSVYRMRMLDKVMVKGRAQASTIYEVYDADAPELNQAKTETLKLYEEGQSCYFSKNFAQGLKCFTDVLSGLPEDLTTKHYLQRSAKFLLVGVPDDWEGVRKMDEK